MGNYTGIPVLNQVGLADGSYYKFEYNNFGQVKAIRRNTSDGDPGPTGDVERSSISYDYPTSGAADCPRTLASHVTAENWQSNVITTFEDLGSGWHRLTMPDGTQHSELYQLAGWQRGLTTQTEEWGKSDPSSSFVRQKWTTISWTQDNTGVSYQLNPRVTETNVYDVNGNRRRTTIDYSPPAYASWGLPYYVSEYANDGTTELRRTYTDYNLSQSYLDWHIIGLVAAVDVADLTNGWQWKSKTVYGYDEATVNSQATTATQHDPSFNSSLNVRANVTSISRWDVNDINNSTKAHTTQIRYDAAGSVLSTIDASGHPNSIGYSDSFSDGNNSRGTFAFPTTVTDGDNYSSLVQYNYDFGATTRTQNPIGAVQTITYDAAARVDRITLNASAYTRYQYGSNYVQTFSTVNTIGDDTWTFAAWDGLGQPFVTFGTNPNSVGLYKEQITYYDAMGRPYWQTKPTEVNDQWTPAGDDAGPWVATTQTYDWKGRPLRTIHPDGYYTELSYTGCGCAGGEVVTAQDETGRRRRTTSDTLGRMIKTEELNWDGSPYSTANYVYDALDQIKTITHEGQTRSLTYDGYGRLSQRTTPEQGTMTYAYNADDTLLSMTDARQVTATYGYNNNRHLVSSINYDVTHDPSGNTSSTPTVSFGYDAAGNRTSMTDGLGSTSYGYDSLSRMTSESRSFTGVGSYSLGYSYNYANELTGITNPWGVWNGYQYDNNGRLNHVYGDSQLQNVTNFAWDIKYRAFGAVKSASFQAGRTLSTSYDNRMRPTSWNVSGLLGYNYNYRRGYPDGGNNQVSYARNLYDNTLDRSYEYDQVGALVVARSGAEARAAFGIDGQGWGTSDGPYAHAYDYDKQGNMTWRFGWGGEVQGGAPYGGDTTKTYSYSTNNNQRDGLGYDAAGNLKDGESNQHYIYNAVGQQTNAWQVNGYSLSQGYDGDGLRGVKYDNSVPTYYVRSSVLGGAVVAEVNSNGGWQRGYVYAGSELLAIQQNWQLNWVFEDAVTKSKRVTDVYGNVVSTVELDPWGADTNRSSNSAFQPQSFTSYTRDSNADQDAMARRYSPTGRFSQPDPYSGSYDFSDPQSLNRYAYVGNDPVNRRDPSGMEQQTCWDEDGRPIPCPPGGPIITINNSDPFGRLADYLFVLNSRFGGIDAGSHPDRDTGEPQNTLGCTFNINISGLSGQNLTDAQTEMRRIFQSGGVPLNVTFNPTLNNDPASNSTNLLVVTAFTGQAAKAIVAQGGGSASRGGILGVTPLFNSNNSYVNQANIRAATAGLKGLGASMGTMIGRVGAHEVIEHRFLGNPSEGTLPDITSSKISRQQLYARSTSRFDLNVPAAESLLQKCRR
jgi:RHS repeat-associated protein